uniref:Protein S100-A10 n=1 Tax=Oryctolagus cuniculus TaxID=9986 RepID=G1SNE8_RABIT
MNLVGGDARRGADRGSPRRPLAVATEGCPGGSLVFAVRRSSPKAAMSRPTETERCIESLIAVFQKYAGKDGHSVTLSKTEFLSFMNTELAAFTKVPTDLAKMPSQMEHAMETMMFTFHKFAGDKGYLTKEDLRVLMEKEFPGFLENQKDPLAVDKIMKDLDQCRDGKVGFQSFFSLIAGLTIACNDYFVVHMKQKGKK